MAIRLTALLNAVILVRTAGAPLLSAGDPAVWPSRAPALRWISALALDTKDKPEAAHAEAVAEHKGEEHGERREDHGHDEGGGDHGHKEHHGQEKEQGHAQDHGHEEDHGDDVVVVNDDGHGHAEGHEHDGHGHDGEAGHAHYEGDGHSAHEGHGHDAYDRSAHCVAVGLISVVVLVPAVLHMALSDGIMAHLTLKMVDTFVSIFIAILWFTVFSQVVKTFELRDSFPMGVEICGFINVLVLYVIAVGVAKFIKDDEVTMATFCGCGAHYIAFTGMGAGGRMQETAAGMVPDMFGPPMSFAFCILIIATIMGFAAALHHFWLNKEKSAELQKTVDEMEMDIVGLMASFMITQSVRHAITGQYPAMGHFFLQGHPGGLVHTWWQRTFMLAWAIVLTIVAGLAVPRLNKMAGHSRGKRKLIHVLKVMLIMLVAWGYLLWGQWLFYEEIFKGDAMFGHMIFALCTTLVALCILYVFAMVIHRRHHGHAERGTLERSNTLQLLPASVRQTNAITVTGISLVVAWSWEHCFHLAFDIIGEEYSVGYGGLVPKLVLAICIPLVLMPVYHKHIKPRVLNDESSSDEEEEEVDTAKA